MSIKSFKQLAFNSNLGLLEIANSTFVFKFEYKIKINEN